MNYQKSGEYKESRIEWLGEVPEHWEISLVKRLKLRLMNRVMCGYYSLSSCQSHDALRNGPLITKEAFCQEKGIAEWYSKIPGLLESHFPTLEGREFSLQEDDESEDVFVEVLFSIAGAPEEINDYYDRFLDT